ncbi:MAG: hypothetical protein KKI08_06935, partial [Armatimonadetes bacterium]|nr:hypothetical protein [Armatimonadota bacterium]
PNATAPATGAAVAAAPAKPIALPDPVTKAPPCLSVLRVEGTWEKLPEGTGSFRTGDDGRLNLALPAGGTLSIQRQEPLPAGPWTMDLWETNDRVDPKEDRVTLSLGFGGVATTPARSTVVDLQNGWWNASATIRVPANGSERSQRLAVYHGRGPVQWLQLSYRPQQALEVRLNGVPMASSTLGAVDLSASPLTLTLQSTKGCTLQIASLTFGPYAPLPQRPDGLLHGGWSAAPRSLGPAEAQALMPKLQSLTFDASLSPAARTYALVALALTQCAQEGQMSEALWQRVPAVQGSGPDDVWVMQALPLLLACSSPAQREAAAPHIEAARARTKAQGMGSHAIGDVAAMRIALFLPSYLVDAVGKSMHEIDQPLLTPWLQELAADDPGTALSLYNSMPTNTGDPRFHAWMAGRLHWLMPNYSRLLLEHGLAGKFPDDTRGRATIELARTDRPTAMLLFSQIGLPWWRQWVSAALGIEQPPVLPPVEAAVMERGLRSQVATWKPSRMAQTPVKPMLEVAQFLKQQGRAADAEAVVREMAAKVSALSAPHFGEVRAVMVGMHDLQLPEAGEWLDRAVALAQATDAAQTEPGLGSGMAFLAASTQLVRILTEWGMTDRALAVTLSLDPSRTAMNYNNCLVTIINACAEGAPERVGELLGKIVDEERLTAPERQAQVVAKLLDVPALVRSDWPEKWIALLPADRRLVPTVRLSLVRGQALDGQLQEQLGQLANAELKYTKSTRGTGWSHRGWALHQLEPMSLSQVQQYERYLMDDPEFYCYQLLNTVVRETRLADDPIWRLWKVADQERGYELPWELAPERLVEIAPAAPR